MNALLPSTQRLLPAPAKPVALTPKVPSAQKRILVVDDDAAWCHLCALALSRAGYAVETAADGLMGWEALQAADYDLLITDHQMPHLNGLDLAARVRLSGSRLPIIMISGSFDPLEIPDPARLEVADVLRKPIALSELIRAVEHALAESFEAERGAADLAPRLYWGLNE